MKTWDWGVWAEMCLGVQFQSKRSELLGADPERMLSCRQRAQTLISICRSLRMWAVWRWRAGRYCCERGGRSNDNSNRLEITIWGLKHKQAFMWRWTWPLGSARGPADKRDKISESKSDRQAEYLHQTRSHCWGGNERSGGRADLLFVTYSHSRAGTDRQIHSNSIYLLIFK